MHILEIQFILLAILLFRFHCHISYQNINFSKQCTKFLNLLSLFKYGKEYSYSAVKYVAFHITFEMNGIIL